MLHGSRADLVDVKEQRAELVCGQSPLNSEDPGTVSSLASATHFEILAKDTGSWQVQAVVDSQEAAVERANDMHRLDQGKMFKVMRVEFVNDKGEFREREICKVGKVKTEASRYGEGLDGGPICQTVEDMLNPAARRAARRVLRSWLDNVGVTTLELFHHPDHLTRLENTGAMLQSAVQRIAMAQANASGGSLHDRQRVLFRLVDELLAKTRRLWRDEDRPRFEDDDLTKLFRRIEDQEEAEFLFNTAIADWLAGFKTLHEKLDNLVTVAESAREPAHLHLLDSCLADFLDDANVVAKVLGEHASLGDALRYMVTLVSGKQASEGALEIETYSELKRLIREAKLPQCRKALVKRIASSLDGTRPLSELGLVEEARINGELYRSLRQPNGRFIGGPEVAEALARRSEKFVNPDAIGRMLEGISRPERRVELLLRAESGVIGESNKRRFGEYVIAILRMPDNLELLRTPSGPAAVHMRDLAALQSALIASGLTAKQKGEGSEILDAVCVDILKKERIFEKISERSDGAASECLAILRLCAGATFTEGNAAELARLRILRCLRVPNFLEEFLRGADDAVNKRAKLEELQQLFEQAKLPETPLTAAVSLAVR